MNRRQEWKIYMLPNPFFFSRSNGGKAIMLVSFLSDSKNNRNGFCTSMHKNKILKTCKENLISNSFVFLFKKISAFFTHFNL